MFPPCNRSHCLFCFFSQFFFFAKSCRRYQGVANLPPPSHFTAHFPQQLSSGIHVSFHTWCCSATWSQHSLTKRQRSASQTDAVMWIFCLLRFCFSVCLIVELLALSVPAWVSPWSPSIGLTGGCITYRQMSTVIANWLLTHVPDTVFWEKRGGDYTTAITFRGWKSMC